MNARLSKTVLVILVGIIGLVLVPLMLVAQGRGGSPSTTGAPKTVATELGTTTIERDAIAKADHLKNQEDASTLLKLAEELKSDLDKEDPLVTSVTNVKRTESIEKLAKNIRGRLKHH
jgi:hypothetical protein